MRTYLNKKNEIKYANIDPKKLNNEALICFNPLVLGFNIKNRLFCTLLLIY